MGASRRRGLGVRAAAGTACSRGTARGRSTSVEVLLHEAVDLEPVGAAAIAGSRLGHAHHETLSEPASLAGRAVLLVDDTAVIVLAFLDDGLVVAGPSKEGFAALAGEGSKVESSGGLFTNPAELVLHGIKTVQL